MSAHGCAEDRLAISDVLTDYCRMLDRMDLVALAALFTEDCEVVFGPDPRLRAQGRDALRASMARMWRWQRTAHHLANLRVWFDGDRNARAESYVHAWHERPDGETAEIFGIYRDRLVLTEDGWRIVRREMSMNGAQGAFRVPIPQAERAKPPPGWQPPEGLDD
jgi:ketosteroid isomerase-like protein